MPTVTWPATLPQYVQEAGYGETPPDQFVETEMEAGPAKVRRRFTTGNYMFNVSLLMTGTQLTAFQTFYDTTAAGGTNPFNWVHPRTRAAAVFRFRKPVPQIGPAGGDNYRVSFKMERVG